MGVLFYLILFTICSLIYLCQTVCFLESLCLGKLCRAIYRATEKGEGVTPKSHNLTINGVSLITVVTN
jgi:hypothetical protein